jgi:glycerol-3-phosphate acyltransferase PlsY
MLDATAALTVGYLLGSVPTAALLARVRGRQIFEVGSGNMGAMNTARHLGVALGALVLILDIVKGAVAVLAGGWVARTAGLSDAAALGPPLAAGVGAVLGHAFSLYVGFRGGKALATAFGTALPLYPLAGVYGLVLLAGMTLLMRRRSDAAAMVTLALYPWLVGLTLWRTGAPPQRVFPIFTAVALMAAVALLKHAMALARRR